MSVAVENRISIHGRHVERAITGIPTHFLNNNDFRFRVQTKKEQLCPEIWNTLFCKERLNMKLNLNKNPLEIPLLKENANVISLNLII